MEQPSVIDTEQRLEDVLSTPQQETVELMRRIEGDVMILGIGGKMGPTLGRMLARAVDAAGVSKTVYGVSRFSDRALPGKLRAWGVECVPCDLLEPDDVAELPRVENIIFMAGRKFGQVGSDHLTWTLNTVVPANVARSFTGSRFVVFSTGSIYDFQPTGSDGSAETDLFTSIGEYANSCLGRERIFEHYSRKYGSKVLQFRLFYAIDLRYGVLYEVGRRVYGGEPINLDMGYANVIWQGDANNFAIRCLELASSPPEILNVTGDRVRIRDAAERFGELFGKRPLFEGTEAPTALLANTGKLKRLLGEPPTPVDRMISWIADWIRRGGKSLDKPTHYETRSGQFLDE